MVLKLTQEEMENLDRRTSKEIKLVIKDPQRRAQAQIFSVVNSIKHVSKK